MQSYARLGGRLATYPSLTSERFMDEISRPGQQDEDNSANRGFELVDRRRLVWTALAAGTGAAVAGSLAEPAAAANGSPALLGKTNSASATTTVTTTSGVGLLGRSSASGGAGVRGEAAAGYGAVALTSAAGYAAVLGRNTSTASGGFGVRGITTKGEGVRGESPDSNGKGVSGRNNATTGGIGTYGFSSGSSGYGVYGDSTASFGTGTYGRGYNGVEGHSTGFGAGVLGTTDVDSSAVRGEAPNGTGVRGIGGRWGVYGQCTADSGIGVYGTASGNGAVAVFAAATGTATALYADGSAHVQGNLGVSGTLSKGGGSFKIDHPLDPANKYLYHSFVESPDMKNVYDGVVILDTNGAATIELPDWFEALNSDYRYQLTAVGASAPNLHISSKFSEGAFSIAGGPAGLEVSWQVTGIRQDTFARTHRIPVEQDKPENERGTFLHPPMAKETISVS